jgi:hypothetical protein
MKTETLLDLELRAANSSAGRIYKSWSIYRADGDVKPVAKLNTDNLSGDEEFALAKLFAASPALLRAASDMLDEYDRKYGKLLSGTTAFADAYLALRRVIVDASI